MPKNIPPRTLQSSKFLQSQTGNAVLHRYRRGEAWFLGDISAIKAAYPNAKDNILNRYQNDSICGTWELLADAVFTGGSNALKEKGKVAVGREKSIWAKKIAPEMNVEQNASPSFCYFRDKIRALI